MKQNKETLKQFFETGDKPTQQQYANLIDSYVDAKQPEGEANRRFVIDELGEVSVASEQQVSEYTLSPISGTNTVDLLKDGVSVSQIDLTPYLDNTNLARLVSGTVDANGLATFTRDDNSTFTVDLSNLKETQIQADFNQTDDTQPDYIKGFPLAILDYNGNEKFKTKKIQFDDFFDFNPAENEVKLKGNKFNLITSRLKEYTSSGVSATNKVNSINSFISNESIFNLGTLFFCPITEGDNSLVLSFKNKISKHFTTINEEGTEYPTQIILRGYLKPNNCKLFWGSSIDKALLFEQTLNNENNTFNSLSIGADITITGERNSNTGGVISNNFRVYNKTLDENSNVIGESSGVYYQVRTLEDKPITLEECTFSLEHEVEVKYTDAANTNGNNKDYSARMFNTYAISEIF